MLRILIVPFFVYFVSHSSDPTFQIIALVLFIAASVTDLLDGKIARARKLVTDFGKFMDPIADKMLVMSALVMLVEQNRMPGWVCMLILAREFAVSGFRLVVAAKGVVLSAGIWGKLKTVTQMVYICMALLLVPIYHIDLDLHGVWYVMTQVMMYVSMALMLVPLKAINTDVHSVWNVLTRAMMYISMGLALWSGITYIWPNRHYLSDM